MVKAGIQAAYAATPTITLNPITLPNITTQAPLPKDAIAATYKNLNNQTKDGYTFSNDPQSQIIYDRLTGIPKQRIQGNVKEEGIFETTLVKNQDGTFNLDLKNPGALREGKITYTTPQNGEVRFSTTDGNIQEIYIEKPSPDIVLDPNTTFNPISHKVLNGVINILSLGLNLTVSDGKVSQGNQSGGGSATIRFGLVEYLLLNGIRAGAVSEGTPAGYFDPNNPSSFAGSLSDLGIQRNNIATVPLFEDNFSINPAIDLTEDTINTIMTILKTQSNRERDEVRAKLIDLETSQLERYIPIGYSGGGQALFANLGKPYEGDWRDPQHAKYFQKFDTIILVGAPVLETFVSPQSGIKRIINIYSKDDLLSKMGMIPKVFSGNVEVINIELQGGINHTNYFYDPGIKKQIDSLQMQYNELLPRTDLDSAALKFNINAKITRLKQEVEKELYSDAFIARLAKAAMNSDDLQRLIATLPKSSDNTRSEVDPSSWAKSAGLDITELRAKKNV